MNFFKDFQDRVVTALRSLDAVRDKGDDIAFDRISVEPPRDPSHGDVATNAAMVLAKPLGTNPRALAEEIAAVLRRRPGYFRRLGRRTGLHQHAPRLGLLAAAARSR